MTAREVERIYVLACRQRKIKPGMEEGQEWHRQLRNFEVGDVKAAVARWDSDATPRNDGQPRSKWLPTPAVIARMVRERTAGAHKAGEPAAQNTVRFECGGKGRHRWTEFSLASEEAVSVRICSWCGAEARRVE